ncbi:MAG: hypothetical protein AAGE03_06535 [Pseudomonadota bacterium]
METDLPLKNRVLPDGTIHALAARGTITGNRGILHVADRRMGPALWKIRAWICCTLDWQGRQRTVMTGRRWTELFFLDEAVAFAAGHRPCGYCRRAAFERWKAAWQVAIGPWPGVQAVDAEMHAARAVPGARRLCSHMAEARALPHGAMFRTDRCWLVQDDQARPYTPDGYGPAEPLPRLSVETLTNPVTLSVLRAGYRPDLHPSAG